MSVTLPPALRNPPGAVVVGMTPDQRNTLRNGLITLAVGFTLAGLGVGYLVGKDKGRKRNPDWAPRAWPPSAILRDLLRG